MENQNEQNLNPTPPAPPVAQTPPVSKPKSRLPVLIIEIILFLLIAGSAAGFYVFKFQPPKQVACTMEAKACPDGTSVGRTGPKCEFAPCPTAKASPIPEPTANSDLIGANWKTYASDEVSFKYPSNLEVFGCGGDGNGNILSVGIKNIDDKTTYCGIGGMPAIFTVSTHGENKTIEDYLKKLPLGTHQTISPIQYREINGLKFGFTTLFTEGGFSTQTHALINPANSKLYYIVSNNDWKNNEILLDQILSTLKFTDQNNSSD